MTEQQLVEAARDGDEHAFEVLVDEHRAGLFVHCYRMLGSPQDAEDALQEALLRAWRGLPRFQQRSSLRSWLYTVATNASLRIIERRPPRVLPLDHGPAADPHADPGVPLVESVWVEPLPDAALPDASYEQRESVELAFIAALQLLPARQRAVLIMRDVLGFSGGEVADALGTSAAGVYSALQRAHKTIDERLPAQSQQAALQAIGDAELRELVTGYTDAWEHNDVAGLAALLTEDATLSMPPYSTWFAGRDAILDFVARWPMSGRSTWSVTPARANGQLAFLQARPGADGAVRPHDVVLLELRGNRITAMTAFLQPEVVGRF